MLKFILILTIISMQPRHITMTSINYIPDDTLKVFIKLDYNTFLKDYQQTLDDDIDIEQFRKPVTFPPDLANYYVNSKLMLHANGKVIIGKLLRMEKHDGDIGLHVFYRPGKNLKTITVKNTFLAGLFSEVENLTIIKSVDFEKGIKFNQQNNQETFTIK